MIFRIKIMYGINALIIATSAAVLLTACGGGTTTATATATDTTAAAAPTPTTTAAATTTPATTTATTSTPSADALHAAGLVGKSLWANNCASCHGGDTGRGANPSKILNAISSNTGGMGFLNGVISADNASNIATYAANPSAY
ncbi:MAG: Cytochrome oxidase, cbb3-type, subunit [Pseudomonadota bacterium]